MRSTVDLENLLDKRLRKAAAARNLSFKSALNLAVAAGMEALFAKSGTPKKYKIHAKACGVWGPGVDPEKLSDLYDQLENEDQLKKL